MWYYPSVGWKGDNSWNIRELHWEEKYSKSYILKLLKNKPTQYTTAIYYDKFIFVIWPVTKMPFNKLILVYVPGPGFGQAQTCNGD